MQAADALRRNEAVLSKAQEIAHVGSFRWDMSRDQILWSDEMLRIHGIRREDFGGSIEDVLPLIHPDDRRTIQEEIGQASNDGLNNGLDDGLEYRIIRPDGSIRTVFAQAIFLEQTRDQMMGVVQDITDRKRAEEEKRSTELELHHAQKMDAVGQLASGVAHEFNNLLVGIRGNAELLTDTSSDVLSEQSHTLLRDIERAGARAHSLANQLLSFARKKTPNVAPFDVNQVVTDNTNFVAKLIGSGTTINTVLSTSPTIVCADDNEIAQALFNLMLNARDSMPDGGTITTRTRVVTLGDRDVPKKCNAGPFVELSVSDNGCGMSPETSQRIFEPFFTTKEVGEGVGLGLAVVYSDISKHGGFVRVDSQEGIGTTISVFLPHLPNSAVEAAVEVLRPTSGSVVDGETILLCDDEDIVRSSVSALLKTAGYSVIAVENAADALAAAESHGRTISLLLTDVTMPGMNGIELGRVMNERHPDMKTLYSSGYSADHLAMDDDIEVLLKGGPNDELLRRVRNLLDGGKPFDANLHDSPIQHA